MKMHLKLKAMSKKNIYTLLYTGEELILFCEPIRDVSDNAYIILQIVYKMIHIKDIFKFTAEKTNDLKNEKSNIKHNVFNRVKSGDTELRELWIRITSNTQHRSKKTLDLLNMISQNRPAYKIHSTGTPNVMLSNDYNMQF